MRPNIGRVLLIGDPSSSVLAIEANLDELLITYYRANSESQALAALLDNKYRYMGILVCTSNSSINVVHFIKLLKDHKTLQQIPMCFIVNRDTEDSYLDVCSDSEFEDYSIDFMHYPQHIVALKNKINIFTSLFQLQHQNILTHKMIDSSYEGMAVLNQDLCFTFANNALLTMTGYRFDMLKQKAINLIFEKTSTIRLHNEIVPILIKNGVWNECLNCKAQNGHIFPINVKLNYSSIGIVCIVNEISQQQLESEKKVKRLLSVEKNLTETNKELETSAYIISHDMRAPLVNLKGFYNELKEGVEALKPVIEQGLEHLDGKKQIKLKKIADKYIPSSFDFIKQGIDKLDSLTQLLLDLSLNGKRDFRFELIDSSQIVHNCIGGLSYHINKFGIAVKVEKLPIIVADNAAIEQIFGNLLDNAIKYLDKNRKGKIVIGSFTTDSSTVFFIRDNGIGIPSDQLQRVFEVSHRATNVRDIPGEGMGIAFIKTLLSRHQGHVWCQSVQGKGSTFFFSISRHLQCEQINEVGVA